MLFQAHLQTVALLAIAQSVCNVSVSVNLPFPDVVFVYFTLNTLIYPPIDDRLFNRFQFFYYYSNIDLTIHIHAYVDTSFHSFDRYMGLEFRSCLYVNISVLETAKRTVF